MRRTNALFSTADTTGTLHRCCPYSRGIILSRRTLVTTSENPLAREVLRNYLQRNRVHRGVGVLRSTFWIVQRGYMCGRNIVSQFYYHGGMLVQTTRNIDKTTRTTRQMAEVQRDAYEALAQNFAAAQRRSIGLANGGLEFIKLQEDNARAAQEWFAGGVKLLKLQQRNAEFVQGWTGEAVEAMREQTEHNVRTAEAFTRGISKQREDYRALTQQWVGAYRDFFSPFSYMQEGIRTFQRATQQGLRVAEEATEQTEKVLGRIEEATRQAELKAAVFGALKTTNYEDLSVEDIVKQLDGFTIKQLEQVREYEKQNKDRETLIEQIDRKIRTKNS
jgi:hypothetical protein